MKTVLLQQATSASTFDVITQFTYLFFLYLIIAVFVERVVEVFVSCMKYADIRLDGYRIWNRKTEQLRAKLDQLYNMQGDGNDDKKKLFSWILWTVVSDKPYTGGKEIISALSVRAQYYRLICRIFGFGISLLLAVYLQRTIGTDLVVLFQKVSGYDLFGIEMQEERFVWIRIIITAAVLSAGSEPLHQLIKKFETIGESKKTNT